MGFSPATTVLCLSLLPFAGVLAAAAPPGAATPTPVAAKSSPAATRPAATQAADAAAKKHAKRTACLKNARAKKLMGADKTSFLKTCIAAP